MRSLTRFPLRTLGAFALVAALAAGLSVVSATADDAPAKAAPAKEAPQAGPNGARLFDEPVAAAKALVQAAEKNDTAELKAIFGPAAAAHVQDGSDPVVSKERAEFAAAAKKQARLEDNDDGSKTLVVGDKDWPLPFPLRSTDGKWWWDGPAGVEEMRMRRIGRNELRVIDIMKIYIEAQVEYAGQDRDGDEVREYAQRIRSTPGHQDGLYWPTAEDEPQSPLGPLVASWQDHLSGAKDGAKIPFGGYYFRVLHGQGSAAPGGRHSYIINGNMIAGFALVAYPARYGETGVMSFLVSHHGKVYERDLGRCTTQCVRRMIGFNPTKGWSVVKED